MQSNTRPDYKKNTTERGLEDIKPNGNLRAKKAKTNLKTKASNDISKSEPDTKKLDDDFDKFIKQLEEIDTRLPAKGFRKKNKKKKGTRRTQDHKKFLSSNTSEKKRLGSQKESRCNPSKNENF